MITPLGMIIAYYDKLSKLERSVRTMTIEIKGKNAVPKPNTPKPTTPPPSQKIKVPVQREENLMRDLKLKGIKIAIKALQEQPLSAEQITAYAHLINACSVNCW